MENIIAAATTLITNAVLRAAFAAPHQGPKYKRTFSEMVSDLRLTKGFARLWEVNPLGAYVAFADARRAFTADEAKAVAESTEAAAHGLLPCGDVAQGDLFIMTHVRVTEDDENGSQFRAEVKRAVRMAQAVSQQEGATLFVRYQPNAAIRAFRSEKNVLRARFGGRLYVSDQADHAGILLAEVTPNAGERTALAKVEWKAPGFDRPVKVAG